VKVLLLGSNEGWLLGSYLKNVGCVMEKKVGTVREK